MLNAVNRVYLFELHESPCYTCGVRNVLTFVHFFRFWIRISDGYQMTVGMRTTQKISRFESTSWFVPVLEVPRSRVIFYFPLVLYKTK
jgi:hypothetical protein